ncbi:sensor histidine kinase [Cohnella sp. CIP 111063]|jgi:Signal transduction histidine kinase|uniref:sensor histidine kinase n=1 Tax=unclassified Cohnella TaxID=2636738 RepID=UPI000B8C5587|nr:MULTISPECIES: sensor histidine kinase [unclassified Cohnella]OXS59922.1 sensor histidine kinase [Cohnella sp. CIP 111063]PRX72730.1 two-component system sensor histidine kinase DesK [Cohnella sp. SGD-V74]
MYKRLRRIQIFPKTTGISPYVWLMFCILPFYFIFRSSSNIEIAAGILMIVLFFFCYRLTLNAKGWPVYVGMGVQIAISIAMTLLFSYAYFAFFLAFFIGNVQNKAGFITLYTIHIATSLIAVNVGFIMQDKFFITQTPFILISLLGAILLPLGSYNRNKQGELQEQLKDANQRISELVKLEERQRIARDLHDTLGQKLSLIGLKSDLAHKLIAANPERARAEIKDVQHTARTALQEVRLLVSEMRGTRLEDELDRIKQILLAAQIEFKLEGNPALQGVPLLTENVLSMCLKEAVNNVVKHSGASECAVSFSQNDTEVVMKVHDNGASRPERLNFRQGHGLQGMKERLEFVNGTLGLATGEGTTVVATIPLIAQRPNKEDSP